MTNPDQLRRMGPSGSHYCAEVSDGCESRCALRTSRPDTRGRALEVEKGKIEAVRDDAEIEVEFAHVLQRLDVRIPAATAERILLGETEVAA